MKYLSSVNPFNGKVIARYPLHSKQKINQILQSTFSAQLAWRELSIAQRASFIKSFAEGLLKNKNSLAELCTAEMGKPIAQAIAEVEKSARSLKHYAKLGKQMLEDLPIPTEAHKSYVSYQPLGTVLAIMPWNFPYWQVCRALGPVMLSGNTLVLKHAGNVTGCALALKKIWDECTDMPHCFNVIVTPGSEMESVIADSRIAAVTFTGSSPAGAQVAATSARYLKKQVLELGGSDPYIILEDADLQWAASMCAKSRLNNTGQSCIAAKRFIVVKSVEKQFTDLLKQEFEQRLVGDPAQDQTDIGPMARHDLRDQLHEQVQASIDKGAKLILGGTIPQHSGAFYNPTILSNVRKGMPAFDEEMFGPVAAIITAKDEEDALQLANETRFGLGGAIFSKNVKKAEKLAKEKLQAGFVAVNTFVSSDPRLPFGGIKESGYGRELAHFGIFEFCNIKTVYIH